MDLAEYRGLEAALEFLEKKLAKASDRGAELSYARLAHDDAIQLAEKHGSREKANSYFLKAADSMRKFRDT